jgi:hypothetical protein
MSRDVLREAAEALRYRQEDAPARPDRTRAEVMASLRRARARRAWGLRFLVPLAALLVGSLAAAAPGMLPALARAAAALLGEADPKRATPPEAPAAPRAPREIAPPDPAPTEPTSSAVPPEPEPDPRALSRLSKAQGRRAERLATPRKESTSTEPTPPTASPDTHALYKNAHRLHFVERNATAALRAWDAYLRADPRGRFATEAHYNRALCLVRLSRIAEARSALEPFASGAFGGYRKTEARALLDALEGSTP